MPLELLVKIFLSCLPDTSTSMLPSDAPLLLTRVCREWRRVAFSTPHLWTTVHLPFPTYNNYQKSLPSPQTLRTWLAASGSLPITIIGKVRDEHCHNTDITSYLQYITELCAHAERWISVRLELLNDLVSQHLTLSLQGATLSNLECLDLDFIFPHNEVSPPPWVATLLSILHAAPILQSLAISNWDLLARISTLR